MDKLLGRRFGKLRVINLAGLDTYKAALYVVKCDCGKEVIVRGASLRSGHSKTCGCSRVVHNMRNHPLYGIWKAMVRRCNSPLDRKYKIYGARGIKVCGSWLSVVNFISDMAPTYKPGLTLDRSNNEEGYSKDNCKWTTYKVQNRNKRTNRTIDTPQGPMLLLKAAEISGVSYTALRKRADRKWPVSRMFDPQRVYRKA